MSPRAPISIMYTISIWLSEVNRNITRYLPTLKRCLPSEYPCKIFISPSGGVSVKPSIAARILFTVGLSALARYLRAFFEYFINTCNSPSAADFFCFSIIILPHHNNKFNKNLKIIAYSFKLYYT